MSAQPQERADISSGESLRVILRALRYVAPFRKPFAIKTVLLLVSLVPALILPWPIKIIIDHVIEGIPIEDPLRPYPALLQPLISQLYGLDSTGILWAVVAFQALLFVVAGAFGTDGGERDTADARMANGYDTATRTENEANEGWSFAGGLLGLLDFRFTMRFTQALNHYYRRQLFEKIQRLPMTAFDDEKIGDAVYRVMYDTPAITNACYRLILSPIAAPLVILSTAWILHEVFGDHPLLVWSALSYIPLALLATLPTAGLMRRRSGESRQAGSTTTATAEEGMANILAVQSLGGEQRQQGRFDRDSWGSFGRYRSVLLVGILTFLVAAVPGAGLIYVAFLYVTDLVTEGSLSLGDFALLFGYFMRILFASVDLGGLWFSVQGNAAGLHRVFFRMDLPGEEDAADASAIPPARDRLRIEGVDFDYPDGTVGLRGIDVEAKIGQILALAGPAGAGKTTLAYLIPRFVSPQGGRVTLDGRDIAGATLESLRSQVAFVFQETILFDGTVEDNLRMGKPDASEAELRIAARKAGALEFILALPEGFQTPLGRGGGKLSVGQKQRLSIARALVRDAPILILDEPTSALDPHTERQLVESLREASRDRLVIVIAHRLSTIRAADEILFLERGRIVERGSHNELVARPDGAYRRFTEMQTRGAA